MNKTYGGFTIVELVICIAVVAILASVSIVAYRGVQERARDVQRMADIKHIDDAIQLYILDNHHAPYLNDTYCRAEMGPDACFVNDTGTSGGSPYITWTQFGSVLSKYTGKATLPVDPCGIKCFKKRDADSRGVTGAGGYFTYRYNAPGDFPAGDPIGNRPATNTDYTIYAQNLEQKRASYGFGFGSF